MHSRNDSDWISRLSNELLLQIFQYDLTRVTLLNCVLCCKRWEGLAISVLYKHISLDSTQRLSRWIATTPVSLDSAIATLTIYVTNVWTTPSHAATIHQLQLGLDQLSVRLQRMVKLESFSIFTPDNLAYGLWIPDLSIAKVLQNLPETCSSLELDMKHIPLHTSHGEQKTHLCVSIRRLIPQLQSLRLALPCICPESFGTVVSQSSTSAPKFTPVGAPKLQDCIIKLASPLTVGTVERFDRPCNSNVSLSGIKAIVECLLTLTTSGRAPILQKLWICDALPQGDDGRVSFGAFVRRDVLANKSYTFPWNIIAPPYKYKNSFLIRMPAEEGGQDWLTTRRNAADLVEGYVWATATNRARLSATVMAKYRLSRQHCIAQNRAEWSASHRIGTILWANEDNTGVRLLDGESGGLLEDRPANFRTPEGWRWDPSGINLERVS